MPTETPIQKAVRLAGGQSRLAIALGISQPSVSEWLKRGKVPATRVASVSAISGVSCVELRPDIFGLAPGQPPARRTPAATGATAKTTQVVLTPSKTKKAA